MGNANGPYTEREINKILPHVEGHASPEYGGINGLHPAEVQEYLSLRKLEDIE